MSKVFVINGAGGAGKDTFVQFFTEIVGEPFVKNISTVDRIKEIAKELGWPGTKRPQDRAYLSDLKDIFTYWCDGPFNDVCTSTRLKFEEWATYGVNGFVFIHCREPQEIQKLVDELKAETIIVQRATDEVYINHADLEVLNYPNYTYIINNNGSLEDLKTKAQEFYMLVKQ